jgi:5'-deoxynucleotidase YfbR-like HD superfamily hydrolase
MISTYTGLRLDPFNPDPDKIDIVDIAHHLSQMPRFAGATRRWFSVAEHSLNVSLVVPTHYALAGLLHDAAEAYLMDMPSPIKQTTMMDGYAETEDNLLEVIFVKYGLDPIIPPAVKLADKRMGATEAVELMRYHEWALNYERYSRHMVVGYSPEAIEKKFLEAFFDLLGAHKGAA